MSSIISIKKNGLSWLQKEVKHLDPNFYKSCDKNNYQRLLRALEVHNETGKKISSYKSNQTKKRAFQIIKIGLDIKRDILYDRINNRVESMMKDGLLEEVNSLIHYKKNNALQTVGYKELFEFINNQCTLEEAIMNIKKHTRRFAKRQLTWFKKDPNIKWFNPNQRDEIKEFIAKL